MKTVSLCVFAVCFLSFFVGDAQTKKSKPTQKKTTIQKTGKTSKPKPSKIVEPVKPPPDDSEASVKGIISFLEYLLNTLGDATTPARDKTVIITESYSKIFRDGKVQVEDDLDETRNVIINKDVPAYLKDVDFFFKEAKFEFIIDRMQREERPGNLFFYKVTLTRHLKGITSEGVPVTNSKPRFIEINYDPRDQSLKIVSIYSNAYSEKDALQAWWSQLSYAWQDVFKKEIQTRNDSLDLSEIKTVASLKTLDLSGNSFIQDLYPLAQLTSLEVLNLSSLPISDLNPVRNLTELKELDLSSTRVSDLSALKFAGKMEKLNLTHTDIGDITVVQQMPKLHMLDLNSTRVTNISALSNLIELDQLNLSSTPVADISPLRTSTGITQLNISRTGVTDMSSVAGLRNLKSINLDSTQVRDLTLLSSLENLETIHMSATAVSTLEPLMKMKKLAKIYCDRTLIKQPQADAFRSVNPNVLVIFDTDDLTSWWNSLSTTWQDVIMKTVGLKATPSREELAVMTKVDSLNVTGLTGITDLEPLSKFPKLRKLIASKTSISDLTPLQYNRELVYLDISATTVRSISPVANHPHLKVLRADRTKLESMDHVMLVLERLYVDGTSIDDARAIQFLDKNPKCLLVYKSSRLTIWWGSLTPGWKAIFLKHTGVKEDMTPETLHLLIETQRLQGTDQPVSDLGPLGEFIRLESLELHGTALTSVRPPMNILNLKSFHLTGSPLMETESLAQFTELEDLDISNTPVEDIYPLWKLKKLKKLNCAGTEIKALNALEKMEVLEYFDCSNTKVNKLEALDFLPLKTLKCFNTKLSSRTVDRFKSAHPDCTIVFY